MKLKSSRMPVSTERIRNARPDVITEAQQLRVGQTVIRFGVYHDIEGIINGHSGYTALIEGNAYTITGQDITHGGQGIGPIISARERTAYTLPASPWNLPYLPVEGFGIQDIEGDVFAERRLTKGLIALQEVPYDVEETLEVGPGLYAIGSNDYYMTAADGGHFMAVAMDSDPRLR
ncbi:MAG TPA: hypothetical protein VD735_06795 [Candidatus Saccharimonadales bacterium]|nr:hypothetical protein [Candidatus Saccharimonadales bacterium]